MKKLLIKKGKVAREIYAEKENIIRKTKTKQNIIIKVHEKDQESPSSEIAPRS